jgi:hypothetical protein
MVKYKYQKFKHEDGEGIQIFLQVIKTPHWHEREYDKCFELPVGALTWTRSSNLKKCENGLYALDLENSIIIENNQFEMNFDPSCFEILYTSTQKIKK